MAFSLPHSNGSRVARFIEEFLTLGGSYLGQPFRLLQWQRDTLDDIYALTEDGRRARRMYVLGVPRKNGKSQLGAAIALYHLIADTKDQAPQVISAAGDRKQARLVFDEARRMVLSSPELSAVCTVHRDTITCSRNQGTYRAVSADAGLQQGLNPSMVVFDELHVFKNSDLLDALTLGSATRNEPLFLIISTAGYNLDSPLGRLYEKGLRTDGHRLNGVRQSGEEHDPAFGMTWYGPEPGEEIDPSNESIWERCNPSWPLLNLEEFRAAFRTTHESAFTRYRLNGWTTSENAWLPHGAWTKLHKPDYVIGPKAPVVLGFDGAWKGDSTGLIAVELGTFHIERLGLWEAPPNEPDWRTPAHEVEEYIREACDRFAVRELVADPWRFEQSLLKLMEEGIPVVEYPTNSVQRMIPATAQFYEAVMEGDLSHDGDPALGRHLANAVLKEDSRGGRITKEHRSSRRHIDLAVAAVIGHHRARLFTEEEAPADPQILIL